MASRGRPAPAWSMADDRRAQSGIDRLRHERMRDARLQEAATLDAKPEDLEVERDDDQSGIEDDRLRLIFTCCHPALPLEGRVALTLRALAGLTTAEIANAFLVPEATMAKRLVRAKHKIQHAGIPYRIPPEHLLPERLGGVLAVLYLMFNEGYSASTGEDLIRVDLCAEAVRLARVLGRLMPDEPESAGLLALMLFQHSRRGARTDAAGDLITLEEQDRRDGISRRSTRRTRSSRRRCAWMRRALSAAGADRCLPRQLAGCRRDRLVPDLRPVRAPAPVTTNPFVALNHAVAVGMARTPEMASR